jgi:hypothetical protein
MQDPNAEIERLRNENAVLRNVVDFARAALHSIENPMIRIHLAALISTVTEPEEVA